MASSILNTKLVERTALYYGKYEYRAVIKSPHMFYSWSCKTIDQYKKRIDEICKEYDAHSDNPSWLNWRRPRPDVEDWEYELIENLFNLHKNYVFKKDFTVRKENNSYTIYTSNLKLLQEVYKFCPFADFSKVDLMPAGVMVFKKEPPAKYRAYMTNNKVPSDFKQEFMNYLARTPDIKPSSAFYTYLHRPVKYAHYHNYLWDKYYIDYDDDKNMLMLMLMFPDAIGKRYKLEKK